MSRQVVGASGLDSLISPNHRLIALTGAGGKTSLMQWIAAHRQGADRRVLITTTTKFFPFPGVLTVLQEEGPDFMGRVRKALTRSSCVCVASRFDEVLGKLIGLDTELVMGLHASGLADTMVVEADGAARKPLKAPNAHEPIIPVGTDLCIGVMGLDAVYRPLTEAHVHRHGLFSRLTHLPPGEPVTPACMVRLGMDPNGLFKGAPPHCDLRVFLNKIDIPGGFGLWDAFRTTLVDQGSSSNIEWCAGSVRERYLDRLDRQAFEK